MRESSNQPLRSPSSSTYCSEPSPSASSATPEQSNGMRLGGAGSRTKSSDQHRRRDARHEVDEEDPAPGEIVGQDPAQRRTDRRPEDRAARAKSDWLVASLAGGNVSRMICCAGTIKPPPNAPCTKRSPISVVVSLASPQSTDVTREAGDREREVVLAAEQRLQPRRERDDDDVRDDVGGDEPRALIDRRARGRRRSSAARR